MNELNDIEYGQIENYLLGNSSAEETRQIELKIQADPNFEEAVEFMRGLHDIKHQQGEMEMLERFNLIHHENIDQGGPSGKIVKLNKKWAIAAAGLIALAAWFVFDEFFSKPDILPDDQTAFQEPRDKNTSTQPLDLASVDWKSEIEHEKDLQYLGEAEDVALDTALDLREKERWGESLPYFEKYFSGLTPGEEDYEMRLITCAIYLEKMNDLTNAARHAEIIKNSDAIPSFKTGADFYLGIIAIEKQNYEEAQKLLQSVADTDYSPWNAKAQNLLNPQN